MDACAPCEPKIDNKEYGSKKYDDWQVKSFARALTEAEEVKADPEKVRLAKMCLEKQSKETKMSLEQIKKIAAEMPSDADYEEEEKGE